MADDLSALANLAPNQQKAVREQLSAAIKSGKLSGEGTQKARNIILTMGRQQIAKETPKQPSMGSDIWSTFKGGFGLPGGQNPYPGMGVEQKAQTAETAAVQDDLRKKEGHGLLYRAGAPFAQVFGANVPVMEEGAREGRPGKIIGAAAAGAVNAATPLIAEGVGKVVGKGAEAVGKSARSYAEKTATKMTSTPGAPGLIPDKETGINVPDRIAEQTQISDVTTRKHAADVYEQKATDSTHHVEALAQEADAKGIRVSGQMATNLQARLAQIWKLSPQLRQLDELGGTKFVGWNKTAQTLRASDILNMKRDLDEVVGYEGGEKKTPVAKAAKQLRNQIDAAMDKTVPGWKDANERASSMIQAKENMQRRFENGLRGVISNFGHKFMSSPGLESTATAAELTTTWAALHQIPGMHGYPAYVGAAVLTGLGKAIYNSVPSQMFRIAFADAIADQLIGKRAPMGPAGWPAIPGNPQGPGGAGGPGGQGGPQLPPPNSPQAQQAQQQATTIVQKALQQAAQKTGMKPAQLQKMLQGIPGGQALLGEGLGPVGGL